MRKEVEVYDLLKNFSQITQQAYWLVICNGDGWFVRLGYWYYFCYFPIHGVICKVTFITVIELSGNLYKCNRFG